MIIPRVLVIRILVEDRRRERENRGRKLSIQGTSFFLIRLCSFIADKSTRTEKVAVLGIKLDFRVYEEENMTGEEK